MMPPNFVLPPSFGSVLGILEGMPVLQVGALLHTYSERSYHVHFVVGGGEVPFV